METEFTYDFQSQFLSYALVNVDWYVKALRVLEVQFFDDKLRPVFRYIGEHFDQYRTMPSVDIVKAYTKIELSAFDVSRTDIDEKWFLDNALKFSKFRAFENATFDVFDNLQKNNFGAIEEAFQKASLISLDDNLGINITSSDDALEIVKDMMDKSNIVPTGWADVDRRLYGGFTKGSLNIFAGSSGMGKSLFLQNLGLNWTKEGKNIVYISLELDEKLIRNRIYQMMTGLGYLEMAADHSLAAKKITESRKEYSGIYQVVRMNETSVNNIRAYLRDWIRVHGKPYAILVDYLDLMYPRNAKIDFGNQFLKDKLVSEELRALAAELDIPVITASQLNRGALETDEHDHSHIAGGISKIHTADVVISISTKKPEREEGYQMINFLKTRNSAGTGERMKLSYDNKSLRITNYCEPVIEEFVVIPPSYKPSSIDDMMKKNRRDN